jgi:hypothetical protein
MRTADLHKAAQIMIDIGWMSDNLTQYCIRGIMEQMDVSENRACKLYREVAGSQELARQVQEVREEHMDPLAWGYAYGKVQQVYYRWVASEPEEVRQ